MVDLSLPLSLVGLTSFAYRFKIWRRSHSAAVAPSEGEALPHVSMIIPCRNEVENLPRLLASLSKLHYPSYDVLLVDDSSTDGTPEVAKKLLSELIPANAAGPLSARFRVLSAPAKPLGWGGKNWPCAVGAAEAQGELLLFTDADTFHHPESLSQTVQHLRNNKYELLTVPPYHRCEGRWEQGLGLFLMFSLLATSFRDRPQKSRAFAIGQYLLFTKASYLLLGGHTAVAGSLAEDVDLAKRWLNEGLRFGVYPEAGPYEVQMYSSVSGFLKGWIRLLRLGLHRSTLLSVLEVSTVCYLFGFSLWQGSSALQWSFVAGLILLTLIQKQFGRFSLLSTVFAPVSVYLFTSLTLVALLETIFRKEIQWQGRSYQSSSQELSL